MSEILHGDSLDVLKNMGDETIDQIATDPPYGYSFMGKDWDKAVPSVEIWKECLRVLKPGAFCMVMSAPRSDVQNAMISRLTEAGFRLDFTPIYWTYASGFPKASNIGKLVDKRMGVERELSEHQGQLSSSLGGNAMDGGAANPHYKWTKATSTEAKALDGSYAGFQPKPAVEVIIVAMKPLSEKTYVDQAMANRKGVTWLDDARIPTDDIIEMGARPKSVGGILNVVDELREPYQQNPRGRYPANLLVSDDIFNDGRCSDSYSRYFDLDKWSNTLPFLIVPKASKGEKYKNHHPTVKPLKLMSYLLTLGSREGDTILDPFAGSGTTIIAAEQLGRQGIGIEREQEYVDISRARIDAVLEVKEAA